jgi:dynein heavy chain
VAYIQRFERLNLPNVSLHDKYVKLLNAYARDIEAVSRIYQKSRLEPTIARDLPPTTGKILWSRQLYRRVQQPMEIFERNKTILQFPEAKQIIKNYNKLSAVLLEYELLYHRAWIRQIDIVLSGLINCK